MQEDQLKEAVERVKEEKASQRRHKAAFVASLRGSNQHYFCGMPTSLLCVHGV